MESHVISRVREMIASGKNDDMISAALVEHRNMTAAQANETITTAKTMMHNERVERARLEEQQVSLDLSKLKLDTMSQHEIITEKYVVAFAEKLERIVTKSDPAFLAAINEWLQSRKSGPITFRNVAEVAVLHRHNVRKNKGGDSPFKAFKKLCKLDHRQIRKSLDILVAVGFTFEFRKAEKPKYERIEVGKYKCQKGRAAGWEIVESHWTEIFLPEGP